MSPFLEYLKEDWLPNNLIEAKKMVREASKYTLIGQHLYHRGFSFPLLRCVDKEEAAYIIQEVYKGVYDTHIGGRALASKIARTGYYWSTLRHDCMEYVKKCDKCQRFAEAHKVPLEHLHPVTFPWLFYKWRVDILGPFSIATGQIKFFIVEIDYFTKWVEVEPVATISSDRIRQFLWKRIMCRFGIPTEIVSDNGMHFASRSAVEFCEGLKVKQLFTLVEHPQSNGQAEAANIVILRGLRKHLEEAKGRWVEELLHLLWSYHTTPHSTTNETPFRFTFGTKAMTPMEIGELSLGMALFKPSENEEELRENLDLLQEVREIAHVREYAVKARAAKKYDRKIVPFKFQRQDLVLRKITQGMDANKLTLIWEGPFRVLEEVGKGAYRLEQLDGKRIPHTWNVATLRMYYS
ncbi:Tf2-11, partial [Mucuna pruriens]